MRTFILTFCTIFLFLLTLVLVPFQATAQVNFGVRAGLAMGLFDLKTAQGELYNTSPRANIYAGMEIDVPFAMHLAFRTGLSVIQKSSEVDRDLDLQDTVASTLYRMTYLELPLYLVGRIESDYGNFFLGAGPSFSLGVGGNVNVAGRSLGGVQQEQDLKMKWVNSTTDLHSFHQLKRFDMGVSAFFTYQLHNGFTLTLNYNKGLRNISPREGDRFGTSYLGLSVGFQMMN